MGEARGYSFFEPGFNRSIKVQTFSQKLTSHAGAVLLREAACLSMLAVCGST